MQNLQYLKLLLDNNNCSVDFLEEYIKHNHSAITRKNYTNQTYERDTLICLCFSHIAKTDAEVEKYINTETSFMAVESSLRERLYFLLSRESNICERGNLKKFHNSKIKYLFCGNQGTCACQNQDFLNKISSKSDEEKRSIVRKRKNTNIDRFGSECALKNDSIRDKISKTNLEKYGAKTPLGSQQIRDKIKKTNVERYGVEHVLSNTTIQQKAKSSILEQYGVKNVSHNVEIQHKKSKTNIERYGSISPFGNSTIQDKSKITNLERYGVENAMSNSLVQCELFSNNIERFGTRSPFGNSTVQEKIVSTNLERYGHSNPLANTEVNQKRVDTNIERYGHISPFGSETVREKTKMTNMEKFGVGNPFANSVIQQQITDTNIERYGHASPLVNSVIQRQIIDTNIERYGYPNASMKHYRSETFEILKSKQLLSNAVDHSSLNKLSKNLGISSTTVSRYCQKHDIELVGQSSYETEISSFLNFHNIEHIRNTRTVISPKELDFYIPDYGLAIEFNGIYWHTEQFIGRDYHYEKWLLCKNAGLQLLMINEDEWIRNSEAIKLKILHLCKKGNRGPGGRKHIIKRITNSDGSKFAGLHHIQGSPGCVTIAYGSYLNDELVAVILFNNQRGTQALELIRFCTNGTSYAGLFSKMFNAFIRDNPTITEVISFADKRYSNGNVYEATGFCKISEIKPDYRYVIGDKTYHKSTFTKKHIARKFGIDMTYLTERQAMSQLGIFRIYDCGKIKYIWRASDK